MEYEIITFGNGEILKGVFDAIAICLNSHSGTLFMPLIRTATIIGALWAALYAIYGEYMRAINSWIIPMTVIMQLLLVPQATVWIKDPVSRYHQKVDHVPYGLAMIAGNISKIGYEITKQVEQVFVLPDDLKYQQSGALFASNLLQQAKTFRITNEDLAENMRQFVEQCVVYDALIGRKYTIEDLRHSDDLWGLVSKNASPIRSFAWRDLRQGGQFGTRPYIITCKDGVNKFNQEWNNEITKTATIFGKKIFGKNSYINPKAELFKFLPLAYSTLTDMAKSAQDLLKQNMMIYAVIDGIEQKSTSLGNAPNFALRRAYLQQRSTYETLGAMAAETLPTIKGVLEAIAYSSFLFIVPISILPFGWTFIKNWMQILLWLQTWAPLYAMLNYIMTLAAKAKSIAALSVSNEAGVTIASSVGLANVNADVAAMAGYLAMSIPFLCIAIVKGVSSFVSVSSILSNVSQGVASQAATESVTGNYSFGNITEGTQQIANTSMLNHSYAASYRSGLFHQADGRSDLITTADGQQILNISSSNLPISLNVAETQSTQLSQQASQSYQKAMHKSESFAKTMAETLRQGVELSDHLAKSKQSSDYFNDGKSIEQTEALNKSVQMVKEFADDNNLTTTQASQILAAASIGADKGLSILKTLPGIRMLNLGLKGEISGGASIQDIYRKAERVAQNEDFQSSLRLATQLTHNQSFAQHDDQGKRLANNMARSWDEADNFRTEANKSFSTAEAYQQQASMVTSSAAAINANYTQEFVDWLSMQKADHTSGHIGKRGAGYIIANDTELCRNYAQQFLTEKHLLPLSHKDLDNLSPQNLRDSFNQENQHAFMEVNQNNAVNNMNNLKQQAKEDGLKEINEHGLKEAFYDQQTQTQQQLSVAKQNALEEYDNKSSQYEKQTNKNLTGLALKQEAKQAFNLIKDPIITIGNIPSTVKKIILEDEQTK